MDYTGLLLRKLMEIPSITQRELADTLGVSLGKINSLVKEAHKNNFINRKELSYVISDQGKIYLEKYKVTNAIILAAGFGSRFVPLTYDIPKGLLLVNGVPMIERAIEQLHEKKIFDISIVVGHLKEKFDYLIDKYSVKLIYNEEYATKNNLTSLYKAIPFLNNTYILSADNWVETNLFNEYESYSWYCSVFVTGETKEWCISTDKNGRINKCEIAGSNSWVMLGPVYFSSEFSKKIIPLLQLYYNKLGTENYYWEDILVSHLDDLKIFINQQSDSNVYEFENLEELREYDESYENQSRHYILQLIAQQLNVEESEIKDILPSKAGMTNNSFTFSCNGEKFIFRLPGAGSELFINRRQEKAVYDAIKEIDISDEVIYFDPETGIKISKYYDNADNLDPNDNSKIAACMELLRKFHEKKLKVDHCFDFSVQISHYKKLCDEHSAVLFQDCEETYTNIQKLLGILRELNRPQILCHLDSICDNFLLLQDGSVRLIDWEYAGMCDPIADLAMFSIYSYYSRKQSDNLLKIYFRREPTSFEKGLLYLYMALGGFTWTLWTQYKQSFPGVEFGEYALIQYRYAKDMYPLALEYIKESGVDI